MSKLDFICVGVQKAGTTTLHDILRQHHQLCLPQKKETHFFSDEDIYNKGTSHYLKYFDNSKLYKFYGEVDPEYSYFLESAERIFNTFGRIKIIFILRNPIDRAYSHYLMTKRRGLENLSFEEAMEKERARISNKADKMHYSYRSRGFYLEQLLTYEQYFGRDNIKILLFEDFIEKTKESIIDVANFIGLGDFEYNIERLSNPASEPRFKKIQEFIYKDNKIKKSLGSLIPSKDTKRQLAEYLESLNLKPSNKKKIPITTREKLYLTYYKKKSKILKQNLT
jgi:hypothetical protein